jgi:hypothetical protein
MWLVFAPVLAAIVAACGVLSDEGPLVPALTVDHPRVIVVPSDHLSDGQVIEVRVTGFGVGGKVWISECATSDAANGLGCGTDLAAQTFLVTGDDRAGATRFAVHAQAPVGPRQPCADRCVIVATQGPGFGFAYAAVDFAAP